MTPPPFLPLSSVWVLLSPCPRPFSCCAGPCCIGTCVNIYIYMCNCIGRCVWVMSICMCATRQTNTSTDLYPVCRLT